ncbi:hypothetical protein R3P38DRAFT_2556384 [Favolaschia claudopus]|uniref:Ubiquitin-like protease family profile domain-containing protein n=1 Tax=Favolaschia claudopus TaxID=2862362 RepID=A0AAW0ABV8_9AGAR
MAKYPKRSTRANQPAAASGLGTHYTSPIKARNRRKQKVVKGLGQAQKTAAAALRLHAILHGDDPPSASPPALDHPMDLGNDQDVEMNGWEDEEVIVTPSAASAPPRPPLPQHSDTEAAHARLNDAWNALLPLLEIPWVKYYRDTHGGPRECIPTEVVYDCTSSCDSPTVTKVKCLYPTHIRYVTFRTCSCKSAAILLVEHGVFPATPSKTQTGVSFDLLDFYRALFERSCDAVTALAAALHTVYERRGFRVLSARVDNIHNPTQDPFRRLLTQAVQWSSNLRARVEHKVDVALQAAAMRLAAQRRIGEASVDSVLTSATLTEASVDSVPTSATLTEASVDSVPTSAPLSTPIVPTSVTRPEPTSAPLSTPPVAPMLSAGRASRTLTERCPACFGLTEWGRSLKDGGDVQGGGDGCFSYLRLKSAGNGEISYDPKRFLSKATVDAVGRRLALARKNPKANPKSLLAKEVVQLCEESWDAANEKKQKANPERYDASGIFVMTCRHGQPIFLCNIDTPGEQQRYIVAMVEELFTMLPDMATLMQAYDVACITDHSLDLYPILSDAIRSRVSFVINGMHAYGHQWACQLMYSPRFRTGMGLADHEGVERFWSRTRKLIPLTRTQWNSRRIWMIDQYAAFVGEESRASLGAWISRQQEKNIEVKHRAATKTLLDCRVTERTLRAEWAAQKEAQTSIRAHAPKRLRRELDKVLLLQTQIDAVEKAIEDTKKTLKGAGAPASSLKILQGLELTHEKLSTEAEALYGSLNIQDTFPELRNLPLEFTQTLLVMRDLKINIRKRATGSFMEWETLDRAVSGRREPLGTKVHQATRKAISRRQPALLKAINKFNEGCATLNRLRPFNCSIPIPSPLSTQLNGLRNDATLHEDVWITPSQGPIPRWLNDDDVRDGIRSLHVLDRCAEEVVRLNLERDNLRHWLSEEADIVEEAKQALGSSPLIFFLLQRQQDLADMKRSWSASLRYQDVEGQVVSGVAKALVPIAVASVGGVTPPVTPPPPFVLPPPPPPAVFVPPPNATPSLLSSAPPSRPHFRGSSTPPSSDMAPPTTQAPSLDAADLSDEDLVEIVEQVLHGSDNEEEIETSAVETSADVLDVQWVYELPACATIDTTFARELAKRNADFESTGMSTGEHLSHYVVQQNGRVLEITPADLKPFTYPTGRLNGFGLNGVASSLLNLYRAVYSPTREIANRCALFSTYDLPLVQFKGSDPDLWRRLSPTEYWDKPIWLIPIFRAEQAHWVLMVVLIPFQRLLCFDSLASIGGWRQDLRDVMLLITRLVALANRNKHPLHVSTEDPTEKWEVRLLFQPGRPLQTNDYDCGVWVLSMLAAFMRGHAETSLTESDIPWVRDVFRRHILTLTIT